MKIDRNGTDPKSSRSVLAPLIWFGEVLLLSDVELPLSPGTVKLPWVPPGRGRVVVVGTAVAVDDPSTATLALVVVMADRTVEGREEAEIGVDEVVEVESKEEEVTLARVDVAPPLALPPAGPAWEEGASSGEESPSQVV